MLGGPQTRRTPASNSLVTRLTTTSLGRLQSFCSDEQSVHWPMSLFHPNTSQLQQRSAVMLTGYTGQLCCQIKVPTQRSHLQSIVTTTWLVEPEEWRGPPPARVEPPFLPRLVGIAHIDLTQRNDI